MSHKEHEEYELLGEILKAVRSQTERINIMSLALDNLTAATVKLTSSVDAAVTQISTPDATETQIQTAADAVNSQAARLDTAVAAAAGTVVTPPPATPAA